jgi:hypothetical protein
LKLKGQYIFIPTINPYCYILEKKNFILRLDEELYEALARWAADDFRSVNGQMEWMIHKALKDSGRLPKSKTTKAKPPKS